jgi:hypothetical protein
MHGDRGDAEFLASAQYAERDLAAIGDENFLNHREKPASSLPGLTPQSIQFAKSVFAKMMDPEVKPAGDALKMSRRQSTPFTR